MRSSRFGTLLAASLTTVAMTTPGLSEVLNVPADFPSIQAAIDASTNGDEIVVGPGVWTGEGNEVIDPSGRSFTLRSSNGAENTIIDGEGVRRGISCISGESASLVIDGFTITNCAGTWFDLDGDGLQEAAELVGGGLLNWYSSPSIRNCIFTANTAASGGAVYSNFASGSFESCEFRDNIVSDAGGGVFLQLFSQPSMVDCAFRDNVAEFGGGLYAILGSNVVLQSILMEDNEAAFNGGGIYALTSSIDLRYCQLLRNSCGGSGAGIYLYDSASVFDASVFTGNSCPLSGGACRQVGSTLSVSRCEFYKNTSFGSGGGICFLGTGLDISISIFKGNFGIDGGAIFVDDSPDCVPFTIDRVAMTVNSADYGGGIRFSGTCGLDVTSSVIWNNSSILGGAIYGFGDPVGLGANLFCGNSASQEGFEDIYGDWSELSPNNFPTSCPELQLGSCCLDDETCIRLPAILCSGTWGGAGSFCNDACITCEGDIDGSGTVGVEDLLVVIASWGSCGGCTGDLTGDGVVGVEDLLIIIANWGFCS